MGKFDNLFAYSLAGGTANSGSGTGTGTGLVAEWKMEEASGNRLDTSGNNNTLIPSGAIASAAGKIGLAAVFNSTAKLSLPSGSQFNLATDFSVTFWVKFISTANYAIVFSKYGSDQGFAFELVSGKLTCYFRTGSNPLILITDAALNTNTYYFVTVTHKAATKTLDFAVNRNLTGVTINIFSGSNPYPFTMLDNNKDIVVGGWGENNSHIPQAHIDQVRIYNRVLSLTELDGLYAES